ncbi:MAG: hypothetical protein LBH20_10425 [Treponema sp.]|jgi:hypothetical protein|nr:hypothetical protein [Treponema sp.]
MKTIKTHNGVIIAMCSLLLGALSFYSCENPISLGPKLNLDPPTVTIQKPEFMDNIRDTLEITGTAADKEEVTFLFVTVEHIIADGQEWKQEWQAERGAWRSRSGAGSPWVSGGSGTWTTQKDPAKVKINWSVTLSMQDAPDGEYLITARAENNVKNKGTLQQRRVVIDKKPPVVTVLAPLLEFDDFDKDDSDKYSFTDDIEYAFDRDYKLQDPAVLDRLHNKRIRIQYEIKDDFSIDTLVFQLADNDGNYYYNEDCLPVKDLSWSGTAEILAKDIMTPGTVNSIGYLGNNPGDGLYLQVISRAADKAGNEKIRSHGWLVYWPDADKPWVSGVGHESNPRLVAVFPGSVVQGQAYDNDGVQSVSYKIYNNGSNKLVAEKTLINEPLVEGTDPSMFFSWNFTAPTDCDEYRIVIDCTDINDPPTAGDTITRYFYVLDSSAPSVDVASPVPTDSLFGDSAGTFTISGTAEAGDDPTKLTLVWLNPLGDAQNRVLYQASDYEGWNITGGSPALPPDSAGDNYWKDNDGNLIWELVLGPGAPDPDTKRMKRHFSKSINLFTDLQIGAGPGKVPLTAQSFVLRVEGQNERAVTKIHSVRGDVTPPDPLKIEGITVRRSGEPDIDYHIVNNLLAEGAMAALQTDDEIYVSGSWGDDSFTQWGQPGRMGAIQVSWNDENVPGAFLTYTTPATWMAGPLELSSDQARKGGGFITARLADLGNNVTETAVSVKIDTTTPYLIQASSDTDDGSYNAGKPIDIYLEFNKAVEYSGPVPTLTLNNNGTANWVNPGGSASRHHFTYTVSTGQNAGRLDIVSINSPGTWTSTGGTPDMVIPSNRNLKDTKNIRVDTTAPTIDIVESLSGATGSPNYYKAGGAIYLLVTFNEEIIFNEGTTGNNTTLTLNVGGASPYAVEPVVSGQKSLLFKYTVVTGQNTNTSPVTPLAASAINLGTGASITDLAGNLLLAGAANFGSPTNIAPAKTIYIDTTPPGIPSISGISAGTFTSAQTFTLNGITESNVEYSVAGNAGPWISYPGGSGVRLSSNGTYIISARQTDLAGNVSDTTSPASPEIQVTINVSAPLLLSYGGTPGTYGKGKEIEIRLNLREAVTVGGTSPTLTLAGGTFAVSATATFDTASSGKNPLIFKYTVQQGDNVSLLQIGSINTGGTTFTPGSGTSEALNSISNNLDYYTTIKIDTTPPVFETAGSDINTAGTILTLNFDKSIYKGTGDITLELVAGSRRAPAVLTKAEYTRYKGNGTTNDLEQWYTVGTNGTTAGGVADLTEKYILNFDESASNPTIINALFTNGAFTVKIPVASSAVAVNPVNDKSLAVTLGAAFVLPVKGVGYTMTFNAGLVQDAQSNTVVAYTGKTVTNPGVNPPFIRVQKNRGRYNPTTSVPTPIYDWIFNAEVRTARAKPTGNWIQAEAFRMGNPVTGVLSATSPGNNYIRGYKKFNDGDPNELIPDGHFRIHGDWGQNGTSFSAGWGVPGGYGTPSSGATVGSTDLWVNPWINTSTPWGGDWGNAGFLVGVEDMPPMWVNIDDPGATRTQSTTSPGAGYIRLGIAAYGSNITIPNQIEAVQPFQTKIKIDCQTPGVTLSCDYTTKITAPETGRFNIAGQPGHPTVPSVIMPGQPSAPTATTASLDGNNSFDVGPGTAADNTDRNGYLYGIRATATLSGTTVTAYEKAARSVIRFTNITNANNWGTLKGKTAAGRTLQLWLRGGDGPTGSNLTPGFPLAWSDQEHTGARLMHPEDTDLNGWYWITWEVSKQAYFHFVAGTTLTTAEVSNGPLDWGWTKNAWAFQHEEYPLYPGGSLQFSTGTQVTYPATQTIEFYGDFSGSRAP